MSFPTYWQDFRGVSSPDEWKARVVRAADGHPLHVYECGRREADAPCVLLVCSFLVPFLLMSKLARALASHYRVIGWDLRGGPYLDEDCAELDVTVTRHAEDLRAIVRQLLLTDTNVVAWSGGALIVAAAFCQFGVRVNTVSLFSPRGVGESSRPVLYETAIQPLLMEVLSPLPLVAERACAVIRAMIQRRKSRYDDESTMRQLLNLNFSDLATMRLFAARLKAFDESSCISPGGNHSYQAMFDRLCEQAPVLVMHCQDDEVIHWRSSLDATARTRRVKLIIYPSGEHFHLYSGHTTIATDILSFLQAPRTRQPALPLKDLFQGVRREVCAALGVR